MVVAVAVAAAVAVAVVVVVVVVVAAAVAVAVTAAVAVAVVVVVAAAAAAAAAAAVCVWRGYENTALYLNYYNRVKIKYHICSITSKSGSLLYGSPRLFQAKQVDPISVTFKA